MHVFLQGLTLWAWVGVTLAQVTHQGAFFAVSVAELDRSIDWYSTHFEFQVISRGDNATRAGALLQRPGLMLELAAFSDGVPLQNVWPVAEFHRLHGPMKIGWQVEDIDAEYKRLEQAGVAVFFAPVAAHDGQWTFAVRDPDGAVIQLFGPRSSDAR